MNQPTYNFDMAPHGLAGDAPVQQDWGHLPHPLRPSWSRGRSQWIWSSAVYEVLTAVLPPNAQFRITGLPKRPASDAVRASDFLMVLAGAWSNDKAFDYRVSIAGAVDGHSDLKYDCFMSDLPSPSADFSHKLTVDFWRLIRVYMAETKRALTPWHWMIHVGVEAGLDPDTSWMVADMMKGRWDNPERQFLIPENERKLVDCAHGHPEDGSRPFAQEWEAITAYLEAMANLWPEWQAPPSTASYWREDLHHGVQLPTEYRYVLRNPFSVTGV